MNEVLAVHLVHHYQEFELHLFLKVDYILLLISLLLNKKLKQIPPLHVFHHDIVVFLILQDVQHHLNPRVPLIQRLNLIP